MTEVALGEAAPETLLQLELWGDAAALAQAFGPLPPPGGSADAGEVRLIWWEPQTWLVRAGLQARDHLQERLGTALGGEGSVTDVSGGFRRLRVSGPGYRELLMIGAVFDAEQALPEGSVAGTMLHHLPVRLDAVRADVIDVYVPSSYAAELSHHMRAAAARMAV